jgi:hypothetical protein
MPAMQLRATSLHREELGAPKIVGPPESTATVIRLPSGVAIDDLWAMTGLRIGGSARPIQSRCSRYAS